MKLNKLTAFFISACAFSAVSVQAADPESYDIKLKASIPSDQFHVRPVESGWINQEQEMAYDINSQKLAPVEKLFQYKNSAGTGIMATLTNTNSNGEAQLYNGAKAIPLSVSFNGTDLSDTAKEVVTSALAKNGGRAALRITTKGNQALDMNTYSGEYTGTVSVTFEPSMQTP